MSGDFHFNTECSLSNYILLGRCPGAMRSDFAPDSWQAIGDGGTFAGKVSQISTNEDIKTAVVDSVFKVETVSDALREQGVEFWGNMQKQSLAATIGFTVAALGLGYLSSRAAKSGCDTSAKVLAVASIACGVLAVVAGSRGAQLKLWTDDPVTKLSEGRKSLAHASFETLYQLDAKWTPENPTGKVTSAEVGNAYKSAVDTLAQQCKIADSDSFDKEWFNHNPLAKNMHCYANGKTSDDNALRNMSTIYEKVEGALLKQQETITSIQSETSTKLGTVDGTYGRCRNRALGKNFFSRTLHAPFRYRETKKDDGFTKVLGHTANAVVDTAITIETANRLAECKVAQIEDSNAIKTTYAPQLEAANNELQKTLSRENPDVANLLGALKNWTS